MECSALSDVGKKREHNEDNYRIIENEEDRVLIIADGMGGHLSGEVASKIAVEVIGTYMQNHRNDEPAAQLVRNALMNANHEICIQAKENPSCNNMGTTVDIAYVKDGNVTIGHVGDSRVYLYRNGSLRLMTSDHSLINDLVRNGTITEEESKLMGQKNIITNALGVEPNLRIDLVEDRLERDDIIMLCTDGLTNEVELSKMEEVLSMNTSLDDKVEVLIYMANSSGGNDNSTVILCKVGEE